MPYTDAKLPFSGTTPHARHASYLGAKKAEASVERLQADYLDALKAHPDGLTDAEAANSPRLGSCKCGERAAQWAIETRPGVFRRLAAKSG